MCAYLPLCQSRRSSANIRLSLFLSPSSSCVFPRVANASSSRQMCDCRRQVLLRGCVCACISAPVCLYVCLCVVGCQHECTNLFWKCHSRLSSPSLLFPLLLPLPLLFSTCLSPVMCRAVDCRRRVCMRAWVRVWASRIRSLLVVFHDVSSALPSASCDNGVHPETRGHVWTTSQIPASIMTPEPGDVW